MLVMGYGVVPQVAVNIPHVSRAKVPINWGYQAVASFTSQRFSNSGMPCDMDDLGDPELDDWVLIGSSVISPTLLVLLGKVIVNGDCVTLLVNFPCRKEATAIVVTVRPKPRSKIYFNFDVSKCTKHHLLKFIYIFICPFL